MSDNFTPPLPPPPPLLTPQPSRQRAANVWLLLLCLAPALAAPWQGPIAVLASLLTLAAAAAGALSYRLRLRADLAKLLARRPGSGAGPVPADSPAALPALLAPLAQALEALAQRQQVLFDAQAEQLETLRRQVHIDPLTGLANRRHFIAGLDTWLCHGDRAVPAGLILLRVQDLQGMNLRVGHAGADAVLQALAKLLRAYTERSVRCSAGRLSATDFVLLLPVSGMAIETAAALRQALRRPLARIDPLAAAVVGAIELRQAMTAAQALVAVDFALAQHAAGEGAAAPAVDPALDLLLPQDAMPQDVAIWQRRIARALVRRRVSLGAFPVRTADGRQLHLDCPLRLQLRSDGPLEPAARWLQLAQRSRLCAAVDEHAVSLALEAIQVDGLARCVNLAAQSLSSADFIEAMTQRLAAAPQAACRLWIDLPESLALAQPELVREVAGRWRPLGVMLGLEHAGEALARMPQLISLGLDCVRIDSRFVNNISGPGASDARRYLQGLVALVQAVGLQVTAEGVRSAADLEQLWALGFDAATGPALQDEPELVA